ncbi:MAG: AEC family transporter [Ectothiorhodospiraceae bacterium]
MLIQNLQTILAALVPIFALIGLGYLFRRVGFPGDGFWPPLERLVYYVLFPALLVEKLATAQIDGNRIVLVLGAVVIALTAMSAGVIALRRLFAVDGPGFTSVFQGSIRFNTYLGIAAALGVYGHEGAAVAAMTVAMLIPLVNVYCVGVLTHYAGSHSSPAALARGIARNPLIIACVVGILLNRTGIGLPYGSDGVLEIVGRAALPMGLMTVGAGLQLRTAWGRGGVLVGTSLLKLVAMPLLAWGSARLVGLTPMETRILVLFGALPTASSAYILARQMGGDHTLVATLLTVETAVSAISLPLVLLIMGGAGIGS